MSVVVPVHDGEEHVADALASVLAQTVEDLELIVVDDGSTDETPKILAEAAASDSRLRVIRQEAAGLTAALIRGCSAVRAPFIARQDADVVAVLVERVLPAALQRGLA